MDAALLLPMFLGYGANSAEVRREPEAILSALADRIYVLGETGGKVANMATAELEAAEKIRQYVAGGLTDGLIGTGKGKQSALATAAYMGYPNVVAELLKSTLVRRHINDADDMGMTPWIAANLSMRQSLWTCNPEALSDPSQFVPMLLTQPYYIANPTPPYQRTRELLEKAGASADVAKAKKFWRQSCKNQSGEARDKVQASTDLQKIVQKLGAADLMRLLIKLHKQAAEHQPKP